MAKRDEAPEIYVLNADKRKCYGAVRNIQEFTEDIRFNACSEVNFKIVDKVCDTLTGKWVTNPAFEYIEKNNLLYLCDENEYFSFPNRTLRNDYGMTDSIPTDYGRRTDEGHVEMTYENTQNTNNNGVLNGFALRPETHLHNISIAQGYNWENLSDIDNLGFHKHKGWSTNFYKVSCINYIPIQPYDIISIRNRTYKDVTGVGDKFLTYDVYFYTSPDANSYVGDLHIQYNMIDSYHSGTRVNPVVRFSIESLNTSDKLYIPNMSGDYPTLSELKAFKEKLKNGAYIRIWSTANRSTDSSASIATKKLFPSFYYVDNGVTTIGWSFPYDGWIQIYSGRRFCSHIDNAISTGNHNVPLHWFVISNVEEEYDGKTHIKTVTAYSYEYTISNKTISLSEDTLPFYIPQQILDTVNNNYWVVDKEYGTNWVFTRRYGRQYMASGILNQILDVLPDWSVGHISSELMTRYRKIDDVDNANLYSFLINDVESKYQCYFVFDCDNMTISAYSQEDIIDGSNILFNWQNSIKSLKITDRDMNFMTALRVHTADDTYGVGLVNPTGNSFIYNFESILDELDFVADSSSTDPLNRNKITENGVTRNRTLKEAITEWQQKTRNPNISVTVPIHSSIGDGDASNSANGTTGHDNTYSNQTFNINSIKAYQNVATSFVKANLELIKCKSSLETQYAEYIKVLDKISVYHDAKNISGTAIDDEIIRNPYDLYNYFTSGSSGRESFANDDSLFAELQNASKKYHQVRMNYEALLNDYNSYKKVLQTVAKRTNINYYTQLKLTEQYSSNGGLDENGEAIILSILTPAEILALQPYVREGDWTNDNSVFSEDYDERDIISTLVDVYNQAKSDMDLFISKPSYDFETDMINWTEVPEMDKNRQQIRVGKTAYINTKNNEYTLPIILELHKNYIDRDDFKIKFTTDYKRKPLQYRFADLYNSISQVSVSDNTFTFAE